MKCTGERPRCRNCEIYEQECVFKEAAQRSRPTDAALAELMQENRRLREQVSATQLQDDVHDDQTSTTELKHNVDRLQSVDQATPLVTSCSAAQMEKSNDAIPMGTPVSVGSMSTYHGSTSTLFTEAATADRQPRSYLTKEREAWMPKILVAAVAEQRQMESINARAGKLDYDGVDPELGLHLLNLHWNRQHHSFLITYPPAFMRDMACNGPYLSKIPLNAIFYGASKFSSKVRATQRSRRCSDSWLAVSQSCARPTWTSS
jgi:hypothetical protein